MTSHPAAVASYLEELTRLLTDVPAEIRVDILTGVREHLDAALDDPADPAAVRAALDRLGSPESVAAAARALADPPRRTPPSVAWVGTTAAAVVMLGAAVAVLGVGALASLTAGFDDTSPWRVPAASLFLVVAGSALLWALGVVLTWAGRSWVRRDQVLLTCTWPAAVAVTVAADLAVSDRFSVNVLAAMAQVLVALLLTAAVARVWLQARARG